MELKKNLINPSVRMDSTTQYNIVNITQNNNKQWNHLVEITPANCIMQSFEWGEFKKNLGWKVYRLAVVHEEEIIAGAQLLIRSIFNGFFSIAYIPRGPIGQTGNDLILKQLLLSIHKIASKNRALFLKIEPPWEYGSIYHTQLKNLGFQPSLHTNQPKSSILVDLTMKADDLLLTFHKTTRYNIRYAIRNNVSIEEGNEDDLKTFYRLLEITAKRNSFPIRSFDYYLGEWKTFVTKGQAKIFLANHNNRTIAARIAFVYGRYGADFHGAFSGEKKNLKVNHLLVWEAMKWAQRAGCQTYDLWGIPDKAGEYHIRGLEIPKELSGDLWGVYDFKRGFGGRIVCYLGAYDYPYYTKLYQLLVNQIFKRSSLEMIMKKFSVL